MNSVTPLTAEYNYGKTSVNLDAISRQAWITGRDRSGTYHEITVQLDDLAELAAHIVKFAEARDEDAVYEFLEEMRCGCPNPAAARH